MKIKDDKGELLMRPFSKTDLESGVAGVSSMKVELFMRKLFAVTLEDREEWYRKTIKTTNSAVWALVPKGSDKPVGVTTISDIERVHGSCTTSITIWDPKWWGKGIATKAHMARTLYAADFLNRTTIKTEIQAINEASIAAVKRVGYQVVGLEPRTTYRSGKYIDTYHLCWINPEKLSVLYPDGNVPEEYKPGLKLAQQTLDKARKDVEFV